MITEDRIDEVIAQLSADDIYETALNEVLESQSPLVAFLDQESTSILTEEEKDILWYIIVVILKSSEFSKEIWQEKLSGYEETNWTLLQEQKKGSFRERITVFFNEYEEEDLLAFVEDTLEEDEDSPITKVGREVIFISAKTVIDSLD